MTATEDPHIVRVVGVTDEAPVIRGTRLLVPFIGQLIRFGEPPSDIGTAYPLIPPTAVYDAISYFFDFTP